MSSVDTSNLKALAANSKVAADLFNGPHAHLLERFPNPATLRDLMVPGAELEVEIKTSEFTSLCPLTGQPDFATIIIRYTPRLWCVESKSIKLYFGSFRNAGEFHEACVQRMGRDLVALLDPEYLQINGEFTPRGGIPFWPTFTYHRDMARVDMGGTSVAD